MRLITVLFMTLITMMLFITPALADSQSQPLTAEIKKKLAETRERYLEKKIELFKEHFRLSGLQSDRKINPSEFGDSYGRVAKITAETLSIVSELYKQYEKILGSKGLQEHFMTSPLYKYDNRPPNEQPPSTGGNGGGAGGSSSIIVCEWVGDDSDSMAYICTSVTYPALWIITWQGGGYSRFDDLRLYPIP